MNAFLHQLASGLASGSIYASLALALVVIYQATHRVNFAQGEMTMFSTYVALTLIGFGLPYWVAFMATVAFSFVLGAAIERIIVRPVESGPETAAIIVFIGLLFIFNSLAGFTWGYSVKTFPSPFDKLPTFGQEYLSGHQLGSFFVTMAMLAIVYVFFRFTPLGLAMRAAAQNPTSSRLVGIRVGRMLALGWGLAGAMGAVAGMLIAPQTFLDPGMMSGILLYGFAGALLGGLDNPGGAVLGGYLVGIVENLAGAYLIGTELKLTLALFMILAVLLIWPAGMFGRKLVTRV
jgi:branched-chain amino acid transport system permease protein